MTPVCDEQLEILRRIAERGLQAAQADQPTLDVWQHLLDELQRIVPPALNAEQDLYAEIGRRYAEALAVSWLDLKEKLEADLAIRWALEYRPDAV